MTRAIILVVAMMIGFQAKAVELNAPFDSIDGGRLSLSQWGGQPILVVNTASRCAYTKQYSGPQALYETKSEYTRPHATFHAVRAGEERRAASNNDVAQCPGAAGFAVRA